MIARIVAAAAALALACVPAQAEDFFAPVFDVLTHPRCLNCHTAVDFPRQGDERRRHDFQVRRGPKDHGVAGFTCAACHQSMNQASSGVPGAPHWALAPLSMAWEDKSPADLCRALVDRKRNGNRSVDDLIEHMTKDALVGWAWDPGAHRKPVPMPREQFAQHLQAWKRAGAKCPEATPYRLKSLGNGLHWVSDGAYNTMFLVTRDGVVVIDPLPTLGARYLDAIRQVTDKPVTHLIYSHEHTDHIGAANLFPKGVAIIAQRRTAELLEQRADPRRPPPTMVFDREYTLEVGGQVLKLAYPGENHVPGNMFIHAPAHRVLMLVDVVYPGYSPYANLGVATNIPGLR